MRNDVDRSDARTGVYNCVSVVLTGLRFQLVSRANTYDTILREFAAMSHSLATRAVSSRIPMGFHGFFAVGWLHERRFKFRRGTRLIDSHK